MKEINNKVKSALESTSFTLENLDEEKGIIHVKSFAYGNFSEMAEAAHKLMSSLSGYAAVTFDFQGQKQVLTSQMSLEEFKKIRAEHNNAGQIEREIDVMHKYRDKVSNESAIFAEIIKQPEVIEAGKQFEAEMARAETIREEVGPLEEQIRLLEAQIKAIKQEASSVEEDAKKVYGGMVGEMYRDKVNAETNKKLAEAIAKREFDQTRTAAQPGAEG